VRTKRNYIYIALCFLLLLPNVVRADNCGSLSDCYSTLQVALASLLGIGVFAGLLSLLLDFSPAGTLKGILEGIIGKDLITGEKLAMWQRLLGIVPGGKYLGKLEEISKVASSLPKYKTTEILGKYLGEETGKVFGKNVKYLNETERAKFELFVKDGKIVDHTGNLYDTGISKSFFRYQKEKAIFVMDNEGKIFASKHQALGEFHHSSLVAGKPVSSAGEIAVKNGKITEITSSSGHYRPSEELNSQVIDELKRRSVKTDSIKITRF
jgi:hypothetical protein